MYDLPRYFVMSKIVVCYSFILSRSPYHFLLVFFFPSTPTCHSLIPVHDIYFRCSLRSCHPPGGRERRREGVWKTGREEQTESERVGWMERVKQVDREGG